MATSLSQVVETPGTCFLCGCTEDAACVLPDAQTPCTWVDPDRSVCSACVLHFGSVVVEELRDSICGTRAEQQAEPSRIVLP